jgi:hypothetical protein
VMNTEQAKKLSLPDLLEKLGHTPSKVTKGGYELWYPSPFRKEKDASFHTSFIGGKWIWNDFGDKGGTVVDFAMRYANAHSISDALAFLDQHTPGAAWPNPKASDLFSFHQQPHREAVENFSHDRQLQLIEAKPISSSAILNYLRNRGIPAELAHQYLVEVRYQNTAVGKPFYGFGMRNESDGFEVRVALPNNKFKSAINARDITVIPGSMSGEGSVSLFEGMTDFLSLLVIQGKSRLLGDAIIMHSLSSHSRTVDFLKYRPYREIRTYLDNNQAGEKGTNRLKEDLGAAVVSYSGSFLPYEDLNDALKSMRSRGSAGKQL